MKLVHLSDLHLGKKLNECSLLEDQKYIIKQILRIIDDEKPDGVIIAGDVYDKSIPTEKATLLFDDFLSSLESRGIAVYLISGNHDSAERLSFGGKIFEKKNIFVSPVYNGTVTPIEYEDEYGIVKIHLLPFIKPADVKSAFDLEDVKMSYNDAIKLAISHLDVNTEERNILVTHQFVTGAKRSESEEVSVGGTDNIDAGVFDDFDYVALGHIHGPQHIERETIRYCGTPLKYSFSEKDHKKSVTVVEMGRKGDVTINKIPLIPLRDMIELRGTFAELTDKSFYETIDCKNFFRIILTDEDYVTNGKATLDKIYERILLLEYDNQRTRSSGILPEIERIASKSPLELFEEFYQKRNGAEMTEEKIEYSRSVFEKLRKD